MTKIYGRAKAYFDKTNTNKVHWNSVGGCYIKPLKMMSTVEIPKRILQRGSSPKHYKIGSLIRLKPFCSQTRKDSGTTRKPKVINEAQKASSVLTCERLNTHLSKHNCLKTDESCIWRTRLIEPLSRYRITECDTVKE